MAHLIRVCPEVELQLLLLGPAGMSASSAQAAQVGRPPAMAVMLSVSCTPTKLLQSMALDSISIFTCSSVPRMVRGTEVAVPGKGPGLACLLRALTLPALSAPPMMEHCRKSSERSWRWAGLPAPAQCLRVLIYAVAGAAVRMHRARRPRRMAAQSNVGLTSC